MRHLAVCALLFAGCYSPTFHDGALRCGNDTPHCPDGYHCAQDNTCVESRRNMTDTSLQAFGKNTFGMTSDER